MTILELRSNLLGDSNRFTLPLADVKSRFGDPASIRVLPKWCRKTGRDVVVMTFRADDGDIELFCPIGWMNQEEMVLEGWIATAERASEKSPPPDSANTLAQPSSEEAIMKTPTSPRWRVGRQMRFGE